MIEPLHTDAIGNVEDIYKLLKIVHTYKVGVTLEYSDKGFRNQLVALDKFRLNLRFFLIARCLPGLDTSDENEIDIFEGCGDISIYLTDATLNEAQTSTIDTFRYIQNNFSLVTGPPGTGKTTVVITTVINLIGGVKEGSNAKRVFIITPSNRPVDEIIQRVYNRAQLYNTTRHKMIVRVHTLDTEKSYAFTNTKCSDGRDSNYINPIDITAASEIDQLSLAYLFYKVYEHATERPFGVSDRRFKYDKLSLGI